MPSKKIVFSLFLVLIAESFFSQVYPVQLSTQLAPPYSGYLPDYADPSSEKLKVIIQFNDFTTPQYNLRLKLEIKGNGFSFVTKQLFIPPPLVVHPGVPLLLSGGDLAPYLNSSNLDFVGINQNQYEQRMALPEGYYSICVKAYDYYNPGNIQVSNEACTQAWFTLSDPPFLNLPQCGKSVTPQTPQNIIFQWTPMNMSSPNSAANTEYEFALWEMRPDSSANPNQVIMSTAPIFSTTTNLTILNYGIAEPPLNLYMKYAWRVRAKDITGRDWFKNNGYSQVCTFVYGNVQTVLGNAINLNLSAQGITHRLAKCTWNTQSLYTNYLLQVRKAGTENWFDYNCTQGFEKVTNLEPNTSYEARVRGEGSVTGEWSNIATFNTFSEPNYSCNDQTQMVDPLQAQPLPASKAIAGLIIQTGQFEVFVTQIASTGPPGWYSGKGYAKVFGALPLQVQFNNIYIDDNNRHQQGVIQAVTEGVNNWLHQWDVSYAEEHATYVDGKIDSIYVNGNQICVVFQGNAGDSCFNYTPDQNVIVVRDENGNEYTVKVNPPPAEITGPANYLQPSNDLLDASDSTIVEFIENNEQLYGFDKKQYTACTNNYELIRLKNGKNYFVPYKGVGESGTDYVNAAISIIGFNASKLSFKTDAALLVNSQLLGNNMYKVTVPDQAKAVYAWYDGKKVGKINVVALNAIAKKLILVPVNGANVGVANLQTELNKIFSQANVSWSVTIKNSFSFGLGNDGLEAADATLMNKYSNEMRDLRDAYKQSAPDYDKEAYYIFIINNFTDPSVKGYMVRGKALGFVNSGATAKDVAHELAHGAFGLEHTFPAIPKGSSDNLMDYKNGTELSAKQWEEIQFNKFIFSWLDSEEDGSSVNSTKMEIMSLLLDIKKGCKDNSVVDIGKYKSAMSVDTMNINGVKYDWVTVAILPYQQTLGSVRPALNNIISGTYNFTGSEPNKICVDVGGKVMISVPENKIADMKAFLKNIVSPNLLIFINGYRPSISMDGSELSNVNTLEFADSDNKINFFDTKGCWGGIDMMFINRTGTKNAIYADGHHTVKTSNHRSVSKFAEGMWNSTVLKTACNSAAAVERDCNYPAKDCPFLHSNPNTEGFNYRRLSGLKAGMDLINKIKSGEIAFDREHGKIDIVAHSMGYAYSTGLIDALVAAGFSKNFGSYYIIAPENACSGGVQWNLFEEVWQYGSNFGEPDEDKLWEQDGVAPQCECAGLVKANGSINPNTSNQVKTSRIFIPKNFQPKDFGNSHYLVNYHWIFSQILSGKSGYVKPRN